MRKASSVEAADDGDISMPSSKNIIQFKGAAADSLLLAFVKIITAALGLLTTKLLSIHFSLQEYGTYSQAMLIATTAASLSILGLSDATNYYYNASGTKEEKEKNISTIFGLQYIAGLVCSVCIMLGQAWIIRYFNNPNLKNLIYFVACMPVFNNLIPMLQILFVSVGKAKLIAARNLVVSLARLFFVLIASYVVKDITIVFLLILCLDIGQVLYFFLAFQRMEPIVRIKSFTPSYVPNILKFSLPLAVFVLTNSLSRDIDKYVIGFFLNTEAIAIYTNAAKALPFDLVTGSFLTVIVPILTRQIRCRQFEEAGNTFRAYLRIGYLTTWIFTGGAIVTAKELMQFLYASKYLPGLPVFIVYLFVDMIKFANTSIVLSACGKTKTLMVCSMITLGVNAVLNIIAIQIWGIIGPAIVTCIVTFGLTFSLIFIGGKQIQQNFRSLFCWKEVTTILFEICATGGISWLLKNALYRIISSATVILFLTYGFFELSLFILNRKQLFSSLRAIGRLK